MIWVNNYDFRIRSGHVIPNSNINNNLLEKKTSINFKDVLDNSLNKLDKDLTNANFKVSAHAMKRIGQRNIVLPKEDIELIENAFDKLEAKGSRESLMLYKDMGLISSVKNRTIITALDKEEMDIVTNIDSTIIIK